MQSARRTGVNRFATQYRCQLEPDSPSMAQLERACGLDAEHLFEALDKGAVWLQRRDHNDRLRKPIRIRTLEARAVPGDVVLVNYNAEILASRAASPLLVSDQRNYSIWNKPAGVFSQGSKWGDHCSITWLVERQHGKTAHLVHRLDRAASGLIVIAHTRNAVRQLASLFEQRQVGKFYRVQVHGHFDCALPCQYSAPIAGKPALSTVLKSRYREVQNTSDLCVQIATGRKHQIRIHLSDAGYPLVGDRLYGHDHTADLQLTASRLQFNCPFTGRAMEFDAP